LRRLLVVPAERWVLMLDARSLAATSRIVGRDLDRSMLLEWWGQWTSHVLETSLLPPHRWGRLREAIREVQQWQASASTGDDIADSVLKLIVGQLAQAADSAPLELLLDIGGVAHSADLENRLAAAVEARIWTSLKARPADRSEPRRPVVVNPNPRRTQRRRREVRAQKDGPCLPMVTAVAIANGETLAACVPGGALWLALVELIVEQASTPAEFDLFCRCRPSPALRSAVADHFAASGDWRALELAVRRRDDWGAGSAA
jgi:hypothetical protein